MVKLYVRLIVLGCKTIDDVPEEFREQVLEELENQ